ncbi:MAG TPA: hypothetical protein VKG01_16935 [Thermoanaerobaculia bacterium]|nr:hypothetical protein [Thermoanaerobaculia bacterium]
MIQTVTVGLNPYWPIFDGSNIWVPNHTSNSVSVVRASSGVVLTTLTGNGLNGPYQAAFDGERVLVTSLGVGNGVVSLWKAADLTEIGNTLTADGANFWITLFESNHLARY